MTCWEYTDSSILTCRPHSTEGRVMRMHLRRRDALLGWQQAQGRGRSITWRLPRECCVVVTWKRCRCNGWLQSACRTALHLRNASCQAVL